MINTIKLSLPPELYHLISGRLQVFTSEFQDMLQRSSERQTVEVKTPGTHPFISLNLCAVPSRTDPGLGSGVSANVMQAEA